MKIVHVIAALTKGGAERVVVDLANVAVDRGHEVAVVAAVPKDPALLRKALRPEVEVCFVDPDGQSVRGAYLKILPWIVKNRAWLLGRDVVHCHLTFGSAFAVVLQCLRRMSAGRRPAVVETYHAVGMAIAWWQRRLHAMLLGGRDGVAFMARDPFWDRFMAHRPRQMLQVIPNGIALPPPVDRAASQRYRRSTARIPDGRIVIGGIGRLVPERRPDLILQTFITLSSMKDHVHLLLAGEGPERMHLETEARRHGLERRVHLPGLVLDPREPLGIIDLYLTVNVGPITGIAALEAAFAAIPIIALQLDQEFRPGADDWIWSSRDPAEVGAHAARLLADRLRLKALASRQQAHAFAHYDIVTMANAYHVFYNEILDSRNGKKRTSVYR